MTLRKWCISLGIGASVFSSASILALDAPALQPPTESVAPAIEISGIIRDELAKLSLSQAPVSPLKTLKVDISSGSRTNHVTYYFERLGNGLWGVALISSSGKGGLARRMLTLQGLIELSTSVEIAGELNTPIFIPGKVFQAFGLVKRAITTTATRKSDSLKGDLAAIATPIAGEKFSYELKFQVDTTTQGTFTMTKHTNYEVKASCAVENSLSASALNPQLKGFYLPVTCQETTNGEPNTKQYAYLIDSGVYVMLSATFGGNKQINAITEAEYAQANEPETK